MKSNSAVMLRRNFKHIARNPTTVFNAVLMPVVVMLMFVYMLGDAFSVGVDYVDYATPGLMLLAVCYGLGATATAVNSDMTKGIINKIMHTPISALKTAAREPEATTVIELIRKLFNLQEKSHHYAGAARGASADHTRERS